MGTGVVDLGGEDGFYVVTLDYGIEQKTQQLARLAEVIPQLEANLLEYPPFYEAVDALIAQTVVSLDAAIAIYKLNLAIDPTAQETEDAAKGVNEILANKLRLEGERQEIQARENIVKTQLLEAQRRQAFLNSVEAEVTTAAWCADFTEDKTGAINTIEIPGEPQNVIIEPQSREEGATPALLPAGVTVARELMSPEQVYFNAAVLPGWQRFKPTYRRGTILALDLLLDTATVRIDEAVSTARDINNQTLNINRDEPPTITLENVPVTYMTCNAAAFEVDDEVVVMFEDQSWDKPHVIGFIREPKPCDVFVLNLEGFYDDDVEGRIFRSVSVAISKQGTVLAENFQPRTAEPFIGAFSRDGRYWLEYGQSGSVDPEDFDNRAIIRFTDGDVDELPERMFSIVRYRNELFSVRLPSQLEVLVLDAKTLEFKREFPAWTYPAGFITCMDCNAGKVVTGGFTGLSYSIEIYDEDGTFNREIDFPSDEEFIWDIAITSDYLAVIHSFAPPTLYIYDYTTGDLLDSVELGEGWRTLTIHGNRIAVMQGIGLNGLVVDGAVRYYTVVDNQLELEQEFYPFSNILSTVPMSFAEPYIGR